MSIKKIKPVIIAILIICVITFTVMWLIKNTPSEEGESGFFSFGDTNADSNGSADDPQAEDDRITKKANKMLKKMSLREKLYQMFIVTPDMLSGETGIKSTTPALEEGIKTFPVGGLIFFKDNIESAEQIKDMIQQADRQSEIPMFFSVDQEGGMVARLKENVGFPIFENMYHYKDMGEQTAYDNAKTIADKLAELRFNLDFAPVADVWSNKENTVIGQRAYGDDYQQTATLVQNAVKGFKDGNVICTLKHFPGHGDTLVDTHQNLAYVSKTKEQLKSEELLPFMAGIEAGAEVVMVGHLVVSEIDKEDPATLSKAVITDFLKEEMGYEGIVITDALNMGAVANMYTSGDMCAKAVKAGVDVLLMPTQLRAGAAGIEKAVLSGEISEDRIDESVRKILKLKIKYGIIQ